MVRALLGDVATTHFCVFLCVCVCARVCKLQCVIKQNAVISKTTVTLPDGDIVLT